MANRAQRKLDHVRLALNPTAVPRSEAGFDDLHLVHNSLPELALSEIDLRTSIAGVALAEPLIINAMTGGATETEAINRDLAAVAGALGLAMAVGSQTAGLRDPDVIPSYTVVRQENPGGVIIANVGAGAGVEAGLRAVEMIHANLLQVHLNAPQEIVMPEGDREFHGHLRNIAELVKRSPVPVLVKECGFGLSGDTVRRLYDAGVRAVDVAGRGGTNFAWIEAARAAETPDEPVAMAEQDPGLLNWGISTPCAVMEALSLNLSGLDVIASGGLDWGTSALKALALGAAATAVAGPVLRAWKAGGQAGAETFLRRYLHAMKAGALLCGARDLASLRRCPIVITGFTEAWCRQRSIETTGYARRSSVT